MSYVAVKEYTAFIALFAVPKCANRTMFGTLSFGTDRGNTYKPLICNGLYGSSATIAFRLAESRLTSSDPAQMIEDQPQDGGAGIDENIAPVEVACRDGFLQYFICKPDSYDADEGDDCRPLDMVAPQAPHPQYFAQQHGHRAIFDKVGSLGRGDQPKRHHQYEKCESKSKSDGEGAIIARTGARNQCGKNYQRKAEDCEQIG